MAGMIPVYIDWRDGVYSMHRTDEGHYKGWNTTTTIPLELWLAWEQFCQANRVWDSICVRLENEAKQDG
jgi:hypothetical protein